MTGHAQQDDLIPELEVVIAQTQADRAARDARAKVVGPGPIYQGVSRQIRRATASGKAFEDLEPLIDADEHAGSIALARSVARTLDTLTGHNPTGWVANGRDVAPLVEQLRELLLSLGAAAVEVDPFQEFIEQINNDDATASHRPTT